MIISSNFILYSIIHLSQRQLSYGRLINDSIGPTSGLSCRSFRVASEQYSDAKHDKIWTLQHV